MAVPQLNECCCGCTLRTGTLIIGWLNLIANLLGVMVESGALLVIDDEKDNPSTDPDKKAALDALAIVLPFLIFINVIGFILAAILLIGVYQKKSKLVYFWVAISLAVLIILDVLYIIQFIVSHNVNVLGNIIGSLLQLYFILVVYSYYRENQTHVSRPTV